MSIEPVCRLCRRERKLVRSHILSEVLWRPVYGPDGKAVSARLGLPYDRRLGRGIREPLLCAACEGNLGHHEDYFAKLWYGRTPFPRVLSKEGVQRNVDYTRFKLFHLANLWRAHESSLDEFRHVQLGPAAERIREALYGGVAPPFSEFPIAAQAVINPLDRKSVV